MGGSGSGRWGGRQRCEYCAAIDVRDWQRRGELENVGGGFQRHWSLGEGRGFSVWVNIQAHELMLSFTTDSGEQRTEAVELTRTPCHYGGTRSWFLCPDCHRRCAKLFLRRGRFFCRVCHRLGYVSQLAASAERPRIMAQRIRRRLGMDPPNLALPYPPKPEGMPWRTYYRLRAKGERYERRAIAYLGAWIERAHGR